MLKHFSSSSNQVSSLGPTNTSFLTRCSIMSFDVYFLLLTSIVNSLKNGDSNLFLKISISLINLLAYCDFIFIEAAHSLIPVSPNDAMYIAAATTHNVGFVQILEVAFSLLMFCSLVCIIIENPLSS